MCACVCVCVFPQLVSASEAALRRRPLSHPHRHTHHFSIWAGAWLGGRRVGTDGGRTRRGHAPGRERGRTRRGRVRTFGRCGGPGVDIWSAFLRMTIWRRSFIGTPRFADGPTSFSLTSSPAPLSQEAPEVPKCEDTEKRVPKGGSGGTAAGIATAADTAAEATAAGYWR